MDQALNSQKTPHTSPLRASYGMSFVSILMKNDRVIKGFYCIWFIFTMKYTVLITFNWLLKTLLFSKLKKSGAFDKFKQK